MLYSFARFSRHPRLWLIAAMLLLSTSAVLAGWSWRVAELPGCAHCVAMAAQGAPTGSHGPLGSLLDTSDFMPRWNCGHWTPLHGWIHIVSDVAIFGAYAAIPIALAYFVRRRSDVPFPAVFWLFCAFIFACGSGHLIEATIFWQPWYRLSGLVKLLTAVVSWVTVLALLPILPKAVALPGLEKINADLQREVAERRAAEEAANAKAKELERFNRVTVDRETRVIDLKREVNSLAARLGEAPRYLKVDQ